MPGTSHSMRNSLSIAAFGALIAVSAPTSAQYYGPPPPEEVYVYGPRHAPEYGPTGAPIENISLSRPVRYDDLDLRTAWGANLLRQRILYTADELCRQMDQFYPTTVYPLHEDSYACHRRALRDAMYQADVAIAHARSYAD